MSYSHSRRAVMLFLLGVIAAGLMVNAHGFGANDGSKPLLGNLEVGKILFLGNSITLHAPAPKIGWTGNWGMAASAPDKDYVHQLLARITKATNQTPEMMVRNIADFERDPATFHIPNVLKKELAFEADVVIVAIGENAPSPKTEEDRRRFEKSMTELLAQINHHGHPRIFVRSQFWPDSEKDQVLKKVTKEAGAIFVDLGTLGSDPTNSARSERKIDHDGVAGHPGDKGMAAIAEALWKAMKQAGEAKE